MEDKNFYLYPNTFQVHNSYIDDCLHLLDGNELKVLLYTIRLIIGFNKRVDHISLTQFEKGRINEQGKRLDNGTGLNRETIIKALGELKKYGLIVEMETSGKAKRKLGTCYALQFDGLKVDILGLEKRFNDRLEQNRKKTGTARTKKDRSVQQTTMVCPTDYYGLSNRPTLVCATDTQNPEETQKKEIHVKLALDECVNFSSEPKIEKLSPVKEPPKETELTTQTQPPSQQKEKDPVTQQEPKPKKRKSGLFTPSAALRESVNEVFEFWQTTMEHPKALLTAERGNPIQARLSNGYSVETIKQAILGCKSSPHHMGENATRTVYDDIELICRDGKRLEGFAARYASTQPKQPKKTELSPELQRRMKIDEEARQQKQNTSRVN